MPLPRTHQRAPLPCRHHDDDNDPVSIMAAAAIKDTSDPDSQMMRDAIVQSQKLRAFAQKSAINLEGKQWVEPALLGGHLTDLTATFNRLSFSDTYLSWVAERTRAFADHMQTRAQFIDMRAHWHNYTDDQRIEAAAWLSREQQSIFAAGTMKPRVVCVRPVFIERSEPPNPRTVRGWHMGPDSRRRSHELGLNTHAAARLHELAAALETVFHENLHVVQHGLARTAANGDIDKGHSLYRESRLFAMAIKARACYLPLVEPAYRAHPLEVDAYARSADFMAALKL